VILKLQIFVSPSRHGPITLGRWMHPKPHKHTSNANEEVQGIIVYVFTSSLDHSNTIPSILTFYLFFPPDEQRS
jgi:hypothetical protein